jgi:hypothetical protein
MRFSTGLHANSHGGQRRPAGSPPEPTVPGWSRPPGWCSSSVRPPQMPWTCLVRSANARGWGRTGQRAQIALASAACSSDLPVDESGKNRPGSADRQAASCHHLPAAISRAPLGAARDRRAAASSSASGEVTPAAPRPTRKGRAWPRCGRRRTSTPASRCGRPGRSAQALSPARAAAQSRRWQRLAGTITYTAVRGRPVLRCSVRANHHDPVTPSNLPGGKPGSGPPPGRDVGSGLTWAGPPGSAVQPTRPKGDPP